MSRPVRTSTGQASGPHRPSTPGPRSWRRNSEENPTGWPRMKGIGDPHLQEEGPRVELLQAGEVGLGAEAGHPPLGGPAEPTRDSVPIGIVRIGQRCQYLLRNSLGHAEPKEEGGVHPAGFGGLGRHVLAFDP